MNLEFTGEFMVPGKSPAHIEADHLARYRFAGAFASGRRVLDIACGAGYGSHLLAAAGARHVDGVDLSHDIVAYARRSYAAENLDYAQGDICTYRGEEPYQLITCFETIEHVPDHRQALTNLNRLLEPGGRLVISSPNRPITSPAARSLDDKPANEFHEREFTVEELRDSLLDHGFTVRDEDLYGQRHQIHFASTLLRKIYKTLFKPYQRFSPEVTPLGRLAPEYFLIVAEKD